MSLFEQKIGRLSMRDEAYELIKQAILMGELAPEMKVKDKELSERLGISRTPVREAMLRLEDEGLIVSKPNSYTMIAPINYDEVKEVYGIVIALEKLALQQALSQLDSDLYQQLIQINNAYGKAIEQGHAKDSFKLDYEFHQLIVKLAKNTELEKITVKLKDKIARVEAFYFTDITPKEKSLQDHHAILDAIEKGDYEQASLHLESNWRNSLQHILNLKVLRKGE